MKILQKVCAFFLILFPLNVFAAQERTQPMGPGAGMPPLSEEDVKMFEEMFAQMSPEELDTLAKIGEDYIQDMESQGKDPWEELMKAFDEQAQETPEVPSAPEMPKTPLPEPIEIKPTSTADAAQLKHIKTMLETIAEKIASIRQKAEADRKSTTALAAWKYHLDDIVYYVNILAEDTLLKYLPEKEFEQLHKTLRQLEQELTHLEQYFIIPEMGIETANPYTMLGLKADATWAEVSRAYQTLRSQKDPERLKKTLQKEGKTDAQIETAVKSAQKEQTELTDAYNTIATKIQADQALEGILDTLARAVYTNKLISQAQTVLKKHEPEALKIKQAQEQKEEKARKEQEQLNLRRPPYTPPVFDPSAFAGPSYQPQYDTPYNGTPYYPEYDYGYNGTEKAPFSPTAPKDTPSDKKDGKTDKEDDKKDGKKDDKDNGKPDEKPKRAPAKTAEVEKKLKYIEDLMDDLNAVIEEDSPTGGPAPKDLLANFRQYLTTPIPTPYQATDPQLVKAQQVNAVFINFTGVLNNMKRTLTTRLKGLSTNDKKELKQKAREMIFEQPEDSNFEKHFVPAAKSIRITPENQVFIHDTEQTIAKEKKYLHLGIDEFDDIEDEENQLIKNANPAATPYLKQLVEAVAALEKELPEPENRPGRSGRPTPAS